MGSPRRGIGIRRRFGATAGRVFGGEIDSRHGLQERTLHVAVPRRATSLCGRHMLRCPEVSARPGLSWAHSLSSFFAPILITRDEGVGGVLAEPFTATVLAEQTIRGASPDGEAPRIRGSMRSLVPRDRCGGPERIPRVQRCSPVISRNERADGLPQAVAACLSPLSPPLLGISPSREREIVRHPHREMSSNTCSNLAMWCSTGLR